MRQRIFYVQKCVWECRSATLKVEDDPLPYFCPIRQDDVVLVYEPRFEPGSTEPFARPTNSLKLAMAKYIRYSESNDAQIVAGDRWISEMGEKPHYDGIQGYKKPCTSIGDRKYILTCLDHAILMQMNLRERSAGFQRNSRS